MSIKNRIKKSERKKKGRKNERIKILTKSRRIELSRSAPTYPRREGGRRRRERPRNRRPASSTAVGRDTATTDLHA
jgi:hypothetical protein